MKTIIVHYIPLTRDRTLAMTTCMNGCLNFIVLYSREVDILTANVDMVNCNLLIQVQIEDLDNAIIEATALCDEMNSGGENLVSFNLGGIKDA